MSFCPNCGERESEETGFCTECGRRLVEGQDVKGRSKKKLAGIILVCLLVIVVVIVIASLASPRGPAFFLIYQADLTDVQPGTEDEVMESVKRAVEIRMNALGITRSAVRVQKQDEEYTIVIQLPGTADIEEAKAMVGLVSVLEFREWDEEQKQWIAAVGTATVNGEEKQLVLSSRYFRERTFVTVDDWTRRPLLIFEWDEVGRQLSEEITGRLVGKQMAIFLGDEPLLDEAGRPIAPVIQEVISESGQISGLSLDTAQMLSRFLNAGSMPVPLGRWVVEDGSMVFEQGVPLREE